MTVLSLQIWKENVCLKKENMDPHQTCCEKFADEIRLRQVKLCKMSCHSDRGIHVHI